MASTEGLEVAFTMTGECDGVVVESEIAVVPGSAGTGDVLASSSASKWALSKLMGHDVAHIPMFWHYSKVNWTYDGSRILSASQSVDRFTNDWWHTHSVRKHRFLNAVNTIFTAWDDVEWHADGFPLKINRGVYADSRVTTNARATGSYTCYFTFTWVSGAGWYPNLHTHPYCQAG